MASIRSLSFDAIIVGGGGAGMRAALQLAQGGHKTAVVTKVFPTRSHTVSAQGGITCAIASADPNDDWRWHMYDTVKGSDYIGDQDAIEYMCSVGPEAVFELEHMGLPFSRTEQGRIYQRPFGGQSKDFGKGGQAARTCAAADRTGHALLHTLYQANLKNGTSFLNEWYAVDLVKNQDGHVVGIIAICIETGETVYIRSKAVVLATGGCTWKSNSLGGNVNTGDGQLMAAEAGAWLSSMEFSNYWGVVPKGTSMDKNGFYGFATFTREDGTVLDGDLMADRGLLARYLLDGPVYAQLDRVPAERVASVRERMINWRQTFDKLGIDPITQRYEIDMLNEGTVRGTGGLYVHDEDCSVGVPGLYAAGDVAARDRIVGATSGAGAPNAAWALSSGTWAGHAAARWAHGTGARHHDSAGVAPAGTAGLRPTGMSGPASQWREAVRAVRGEMLPIAKNAIRTEAILTDALGVLDAAWASARESLRATGTDVLRAREAAAMTAMGRWAYRSALARTETRGMHYRADHTGLDAYQRHRILAGGLDEVWTKTDPVPAEYAFAADGYALQDAS